MTCIDFSIGETRGVVCVSNEPVSLHFFGSRVWLEFHEFLGPTFYRIKSSTIPILKPTKGNWKAFYAWLKDREQRTSATYVQATK